MAAGNYTHVSRAQLGEDMVRWISQELAEPKSLPPNITAAFDLQTYKSKKERLAIEWTSIRKVKNDADSFVLPASTVIDDEAGELIAIAYTGIGGGERNFDLVSSRCPACPYGYLAKFEYKPKNMSFWMCDHCTRCWPTITDARTLTGGSDLIALRASSGGGGDVVQIEFE